jgi:UDP-N-acetylglucosamine--N-acetylmuramyl-(pentapeptide) pyrophosphoryl-undecaprenol N-acetylglucosamine transferase
VRVIFSGGGTGGHLYPALAIARALMRLRPDARPHFVGAQRGIEAEVLARCEFPYTLLGVHPLYRRQWWNNWRTIVGALGGWRGVSALARQERPAITVGTGGYASSVALAWSLAHRVPVVQHIADAFPGLAARAFARGSRECYLGFAEARDRLPGRRTRYIVTGNPIEPPPSRRPDRQTMLARWGFDRDTRVLLIFGGSQGSLAINEVVAAWVRGSIPAGWSVLWATGRATNEQFRTLDGPRVRVVPYLAPISEAYAVADLALVRGGAIGTAELCAWGVPMIIVPLPTAAQDHQTWNARSLEAAGAAVHLPQRELTIERLSSVVRSLAGDSARLASLGAAARRTARPGAAADIARHIANLLPL